MVIGDVSFGEVVSALYRSQGNLGREVNPNVYPPDEWRKKLADGQSFVTTVLGEPKVFLVGDADELGRLAPQRVALDLPDGKPGGLVALAGAYGDDPGRPDLVAGIYAARDAALGSR